MNPKALYLEITESQMLNIDKSKEILTGLKQLGIKIAIDDFGKGFSSLGTIASLSIDKIKIDQFFIKDMTNNQKHGSWLKRLSKWENLNTVVVAEGVETKEQVLLLKI